MQILLLYIAEDVKFKKDRVAEIMRSSPSFSNFQSPNLSSATLEADFTVGGEETRVRLEADLESISISGSGDISLKAVLEIQAQYGQPLRLIDLDYSFDVDVSTVTSLQDLRRRMESSTE